jgi:hypothetical protein
MLSYKTLHSSECRVPTHIIHGGQRGIRVGLSLTSYLVLSQDNCHSIFAPSCLSYMPPHTHTHCTLKVCDSPYQAACSHVLSVRIWPNTWPFTEWRCLWDTPVKKEVIMTNRRWIGRDLSGGSHGLVLKYCLSIWMGRLREAMKKHQASHFLDLPNTKHLQCNIPEDSILH